MTLMPVPVVSAAVTMATPIPVVRAENVPRTCVAASEAVEAKSSRTPVVVPVSIPVDVMRSIEVPAPKTEVVWLRLSNVAVPTVSALLTSFTASPAVVLTLVTSNVLPEPVVDALVRLTMLPVKPVVTPDCTTESRVAVVDDAALPRILTTVPATWPDDSTSRMVPFVAPPVSTELDDSWINEPPSAITLVVCAILIPIPVVRPAVVPKSSTVPVVSDAAVRVMRTVSSFAAVLNSLRIADVPVAPVWFEKNMRPVVAIAVAAEVTCNPIPVVNASIPTTLMPVPVVIEGTETTNADPAASAADAVICIMIVSSFAADATSTNVAEVPVAPLWLMYTRRPAPVIAVADEAMFKPIPVVRALRFDISIPLPVVMDAPDTWKAIPKANAAEAVTFKIMVSSFAAEANSERMADVPVAPVWSTRSRRPAPVIAVADDEITTAMPEVRPFAATRKIPAAVVALFATAEMR